MIRSFCKKILRKININITKYNPSVSRSAQLERILKYKKIDTILDIGANNGQFAEEIFSSDCQAKVISFEPLSCLHLILNKKAQRRKNWVIHPRCAVGAVNAEVYINISDNLVSSSVLQMHKNENIDYRYVGGESVNCISLDSIISEYGLDSSSLFLKIDVQGYESNVLRGADKLLDFTNVVFCELSLVQLYSNEPSWFEIIELLERKGFEVWGIWGGYCNNKTGQSYQLDAFFVRP